MELINLFLTTSDWKNVTLIRRFKVINVIFFSLEFCRGKGTSFSPCLVDSLLIREWIVVLMDKDILLPL